MTGLCNFQEAETRLRSEMLIRASALVTLLSSWKNKIALRLKGFRFQNFDFSTAFGDVLSIESLGCLLSEIKNPLALSRNDLDHSRVRGSAPISM